MQAMTRNQEIVAQVKAGAVDTAKRREDALRTEKVIEIEIKSVFGRLQAYPKCSRAVCFAKIANTTTLTAATLACVLQLGYVINELSRYGTLIRQYVADGPRPSIACLPMVDN